MLLTCITLRKSRFPDCTRRLTIFRSFWHAFFYVSHCAIRCDIFDNILLLKFRNTILLYFIWIQSYVEKIHILLYYINKFCAMQFWKLLHVLVIYININFYNTLTRDPLFFYFRSKVARVNKIRREENFKFARCAFFKRRSVTYT